MKTLYAFDFDGTITPIPGSYSRMFSGVSRLKDLPLNEIAVVLKPIMNDYILPKDVIRLHDLLTTIYKQPNTILTIQTNNYENIVLACLVHHIGIPLKYIDLSKSRFRDCDFTKCENINALALNPMINQIIYFDDCAHELTRAIECSSKISVVFCFDGIKCLGKLLTHFPVIDGESLSLFLKEYTLDQKSFYNFITNCSGAVDAAGK